MNTPCDAPLLGPDDPAPTTLLNADADAPLLFVCDHACSEVPARLNGLGLPPSVLGTHIAVDIGAAAVTRQLASEFRAPTVLAGYSRLVIDLNRDPWDFTGIREISDGVMIPGNRQLTKEDRERRLQEIFHPYHHTIDGLVSARLQGPVAPAFIAVHSFTPELRGQRRRWDLGVLMNRDRRLGKALIAELSALAPSLLIGDNEPYSGLSQYGYTIETHALPIGLPNVLLEIRQDLIAEPAGQAHWAGMLTAALRRLLNIRGLFVPYFA